MNAAVISRPNLSAVIAIVNSVCDINKDHGFRVDNVHNKPGENMGSLGILGFAKAFGLEDTDLISAMFCEALEEIREDKDNVSKNHHNLRAFVAHGMSKVFIDCRSCIPKSEFGTPEALLEYLNDRAQETEDEHEIYAINRIISALH